MLVYYRRLTLIFLYTLNFIVLMFTTAQTCKKH